ncbi:hypothetical protein GCM10009642_55660 [Nocardiopsis metallicus]
MAGDGHRGGVETGGGCRNGAVLTIPAALPLFPHRRGHRRRRREPCGERAGTKPEWDSVAFGIRGPLTSR